ncbi:MAG: SIR2 family protein, partial [Candidatus Sedimenticola sp. (ex Thyasira tokunagai)]
FPLTGRRVRMPTLLPLWRAARTTGKQCGLTATGDYQPSLRSPWLAAIVGVDNLMARHLDVPGSVIHIHGAVSDHESIVATTKSYLEHYDHENTQEFLKQLFTRKVVLFIGYGLEEAEILEHILRRGDARSTGELKRFALQGFFKEQATLFESLQRYYANSFGVELIGFARDEDDYAALDKVVNTWSSKLQINAPALVEDFAIMDEVLADE